MGISVNAQEVPLSTPSGFEPERDVVDVEQSLWDDAQESTSTFAGSNTVLLWRDYPEVQRTLQEGFLAILHTRQAYLERLNELQPDWISGGADVPSPLVVARTKDLLRYIEYQTRANELSVIPRLVLGPLPEGGIEVELHAGEDSALFVTMHNDESVEIDVKYRGFYTSLDTDALELGNKVLSRYESISDK